MSTLAELPNMPSETKWLKRILVPFWILRDVLMTILLIAYIGSIYIMIQEDSMFGGALTARVFLVLLLFACTTLDILSIVMLARHSLRPKTFLIFQCVETAIWSLLVVLEIVAAARSSELKTAFPFLFTLVLFVPFLGLLVYASVVYHRARKAARKEQFVPTSSLATSAYPAVSNPFESAYAAPSRLSLYSIGGEDASGGKTEEDIYRPPLAQMRIERYA